MGEYLAGAHHLRNITEIFTKDQHGLRLKDINHKDKQNFDAVTRITRNANVFTIIEKFYGCFLGQIFNTTGEISKSMVCHKILA